MGNTKYLVQNVDMLTEEISLENNNKYKHPFLNKFTMTPEPYLDVLIIEEYEMQKQIQPIQEEKTSREIQAELRSFC